MAFALDTNRLKSLTEGQLIIPLKKHKSLLLNCTLYVSLSLEMKFEPNWLLMVLFPKIVCDNLLVLGIVIFTSLFTNGVKTPIGLYLGLTLYTLLIQTWLLTT